MKKGALIFLTICLIAISYCGSITASSADLSWDYKGQWYSGGFGDYFGWKNFVDFFIDTMLNVKISEKDGKIGLTTTDPLGNENTNTDLVSFDKNTGKLKFAMEFTLPSGKKKYIEYNGSINGEYNISKFFDYNKYLNKSLGDLIYDLLEKDRKVTFVGEMSNITIAPSNDFSSTNPKMEITYEKNLGENYTSPIPLDTAENSSTAQNYSTSSSSNYTVNSSISFFEEKNESEQVGKIENKTLTNDIIVRIINAQPNKTKLSIFIGGEKEFSIDNTDYDSIKWYSNNKVMENNSNAYTFRGISKGDYTLKVEIKKAGITKSTVWKISVLEVEKIKKNVNWTLIIGSLIVIAVIVFGIIFFILNKSSGTEKRVD